MMPQVHHNQVSCAEELILWVVKGNLAYTNYHVSVKNLTSCKRIKKMTNREEKGQ